MDLEELADTPWTSFRAAANAIYQWANETFPERVPEATLSKLVLEEIPELLMHKKTHGGKGIEGELADCFILLLDLAVIWGVDIPVALRNKMLINGQRTWKYDRYTRFYNHDEARGSGQAATDVRHPAVDDRPGDTATDCSGTPVSSMGVGALFVRSHGRWHAPQLVREGGCWLLGTCARCGRNLDGRPTESHKSPDRRTLAGDLEETEGTGIG